MLYILFSHFCWLSYMQAVPGGWRRWLVTNAEARRRDSKTKWRSRIRSTKRGFVKKNVGGFRYKPRGDWFSFAKVRKLCFLCLWKQTRETSISHRCTLRIHPTSSAGTACTYDSQRKWEKSILNMDIFLTKMHQFATGGLYLPPGAVWRTFYYGWAHFIWLLLDCWTKTPAYSHSNTWKSKKKCIITRLDSSEDESYIHLGCFEGE